MQLVQLTLDQWIAIASSIGTLLAAFLAFFSIREIRKQWTQQHLARLTPTTGTFNTKFEDFMGWEAPEPEAAKSLPAATNDEFLLPLINVGNGAATDVHLEWDADVDHWIQAINTLSAQTGAGIGVSSKDGWITYFRGGKSLGASRPPRDTDQYLEYVLPVTSNRDGARIGIPPAIKMLLQAYYRCYFTNGGDREVFRNPADEFSIDLKISYKDTIGRQFSRRSIINISVLMASADKDGNPQYICYVFAPARTEPAEGDSIITRVLLGALKGFLSGAAAPTVGGVAAISNASREAEK